jgi:hypothetical protein
MSNKMSNKMSRLEGRLATLVGSSATDPAAPRVDLFFLPAEEQERWRRIAET